MFIVHFVNLFILNMFVNFKYVHKFNILIISITLTSIYGIIYD